VSLHDRWEEQAPNWIRWAREPGHDSYWRFHRDAFLGSLPSPGSLTLDVGCGEGRVTRDLSALGHRVIGIDQSASMIASAREADPEGEYIQASAVEMPFPDGEADLVISFMSLMDMEDMAGGVSEMARVLDRDGLLVAAVVHPINSAGQFIPREGDDAPFVIESYLDSRPYEDYLERDGLEITFHSLHHTLEDFSRAFEGGGFLIRRVCELYDDENPRWRRVPLFFHLHAIRR
jgi:SAM-dependent methyltransferase